MSIKIQINSLEALERLIGGDSELEIELRNSVVQDFANKHLKALALVYNENHFKALTDSVYKEMKAKFHEEYGLKVVTEKGPYSYSTPKQVVQLKDETKAQFKFLIEKETMGQVATISKGIVDNLLPSIMKTVEKQVNIVVDEITKDEVKRRVDKKLKEILA